MNDLSQVTEEFRRFIVGICNTDPGQIVADGKWHRFRITDTRHKSSKPGRYLLHPDGKANGIFMDWRDEVRHKWRSDGTYDSIDREELRRRREQRQAKLDASFRKAAAAASAFWSQCIRINGKSHPYLDRKKISPNGSRYGSGKMFGLGDVECVIIPIYSAENKLVTVQAIREDGERRFWKDSSHEGAHSVIGADDGASPVIFCEGFATACSIHEATGHPVVMTINSGNMTQVARWAGHKFAGRDMIVAGDDDWHLIDKKPFRNVGKESAQAMARALGARVIFPDMFGLVTDGGDDFNDMADHYGLEEVAALFAAPGEPEEKELGEKLVTATPFTWRDPSLIPPRQWVYGKHLLRKFVSVDVAAGGVGKSSLKIGEALAIASGRDIYEKGLPEGACSVWLFNLEDPHEEMERRIHATAEKFGIAPEELGGRLYVDSGRDQPLVIAKEGPDGAMICAPVVDALIAEMIDRKIDVLMVDPFISSHAVSENDNNAIDIVAREWNLIAEKTGAAINLVHHVRKGNGVEATADSARGASSLIGKARSVLVYNRMSPDEAASLGVDEDVRRFHFRVDNDKANLAPPDATDWYRMNNVDLPNGDSVGVACAWEPPSLFDGVTKQHLMQVQFKIAEGSWRESSQAKAWAGHPVGEVLGIDSHDKKNARRISRLLKTWVSEGVLSVVDDYDERRNLRSFIVVGREVE